MAFGLIMLWANTKVEQSFGLTKVKMPKLKIWKSLTGWWQQRMKLSKFLVGLWSGRRMDEKRACCVRKQITLGGYRDEQNWRKVHEAMVDAMIRFICGPQPPHSISQEIDPYHE